MSAKTLLLIDGSSYLYRAYYAMGHLSAPNGMRTNAIYGVLNMLRRARNEMAHDYCACVFDAKGKNFRHELFVDYKANRSIMPDDLQVQMAVLPEIVELMGWKVLQISGVEADDVIGTLAKQAQEQDLKVIISTGDKDMAQLVNERVICVNSMDNKVWDIEGVYQKFQVYPHQIIDFLSLMGDKSDNVPGVDKCGEKTAIKWLAQYDNLENIIAHANEIKGKIGENLRAALPQLALSKQLVTIKTDVNLTEILPNGIADLAKYEPKWNKLAMWFRELGFKSWLKEAEKWIAAEHQDNNEESLFDWAAEKNIDSNQVIVPHVLDYQAITTQAQFDELLVKLAQSTVIAIDTETTSLDAMKAHLVGISIAFAAGQAVYIPLGHSVHIVNEQLNLQEVLDKLKPYLENESLHKIGQNLKYDQHIFANYNIHLKGIIGDAMLASYVVESHLGHSLDELAQRWLNLPTITYESLCGKGSKQIGFADVDLLRATEYACQDADFTWRIEALLRNKMNDNQLFMYQNIELPIAQILFEMERVGVLIDRQELIKQSDELGRELIQCEQQAYDLAGQPFNLNSPKQLQEILFQKMGIPTKGLKKTSSGGISTNEAVLERLADDYPLPKIILKNRSLAKLKSTYTDALIEKINPNTGRVHTHYAQAVVNTGRLASNNPNLQNIPIRTPEGRRVRRAFIAEKGKVIVSADYSQIELRIMAHLSGDATLLNAFEYGEDVHKRTAAEIFGISVENISSEQRRYAKTINFGLIYGMGQYGLAKALGIDELSAKTFIEQYFARYTGVADYMNRTKEQALQYGFVETLFGRKLYLSGIRSTNATERAGAERAAINAPMQGTAADLIKLAMLSVNQFLKTEQLDSRLIMQVHDELVLEVPETELTLLQQRLPKLMADVGLGKLQVPLLAEIGVGANWDEAH